MQRLVQRAPSGAQALGQDVDRDADDHLKLTTNEAVARLTGNWKQDIAAYYAVRAEILGMSDTLANGIIEQFPGRFA